MHIPWSDVQLVLTVADTGSLSRAARQLRVTQPTVSRRLAELEATVGEPMFVRDVSGTRLTAFGERFVEPARRMADAGAEIERVAAGVERGPRGTVRISAPPGVAAAVLAPFAATLHARLPDVQLEVIATVRYVDLLRGEADLAVRFPSSSIRESRRDLAVLASVRHPVAAYAAPSYLARLPRGAALADIEWIGWPPALAHLPPNPQLAARIAGFRPVFTSDDFLVQLRAAEAGIGAVILSGFEGSPRSTLVKLPIDLGRLTAEHQLVAARSALAVPRVRLVAEQLAAELNPPRRRSR
jgi:DNA-binding transcriptional LysR family regulator